MAHVHGGTPAPRPPDPRYAAASNPGPAPAQSVHTLREGCIWEGSTWEIHTEAECVKAYHEPCRHCRTISPYAFIVPRLVRAENQGGYDSTGVCLDCILEAAQTIGVTPMKTLDEQIREASDRGQGPLGTDAQAKVAAQYVEQVTRALADAVRDGQAIEFVAEADAHKPDWLDGRRVHTDTGGRTFTVRIHPRTA